MPSPTHPTELPPFSRTRFAWFMRYVEWYLRRHFHAVRLLEGEPGGPDHPDIAGEPVIVYTNHPGWWDPLIFLRLAGRLYPDRLNYGPIDAAALGKYKFFETIGFLGIEPDRYSGAARFLRFAKAAGRRSDVLFWITSQGTFVDPRSRPVEIRPGVGHAVASGRGLVVPLAVEYPFWNERFPEALVAFGQAIRIADHPGRDADEWTHVLARQLEATQDRLAAAAMGRDQRRFRVISTGRVGVGGMYDLVRRFGAWRRGERFDASHGGDTERAP
ncbi:MAG: lysophospholipid acyltransferase family protein [Planctomycetia bacterium]